MRACPADVSRNRRRARLRWAFNRRRVRRRTASGPGADGAFWSDVPFVTIRTTNECGSRRSDGAR